MIFTELFAKSLYRSRAGNHFYDIWADFGPVGNTEKKTSFGPIMSNFWEQFFHV